MQQFIGEWQVWARALGIFLGAPLLALVAHWIVFRVLRRLEMSASIAEDLYRPSRLILPVMAAIAGIGALPIASGTTAELRRLLSLVLIAAFAWLAISVLRRVLTWVASLHRTEGPDNVSARRIRTQLTVLYRIMVFVICLFAVAVGLMMFPSIRQIGTSLLASAGLAGLVIGLAARPTISNLLAGVQLALAEPIRLDDVVIVEGEWGTIEEITTTYVVVRIWDKRRLVVPLSYFIERPFQNWTRHSTDLLGTVFIYADYSVPVDEVRAELHRILENSGMWDGQVCKLQVTNATEHTVELRALMSAANSGQAWDLRCLVREKLIDFLQRRYPECLPRARTEISRRPQVRAAETS
ncbi:MAG TPA: mechanosensitive ion channel family protein [Bryobacteraceae bacterium]|nr:mechanosensitive ion channel family protein [Bryobacteraceae bacterium]HOL73520.1 mechanosensitive ion channel family protein [Bryobacteraceae bacterium]HOQ46368.1 mechanosensitive ion channel family protein [Bryobacteraceae bacterium]HPQ16339.1 mechanosensitive ion channel family protein [Bryobacteraceae bacterium]HPU72195.1 mechanosensitive ion channel family protein [Bryobacteraceae bacterium]